MSVRRLVVEVDVSSLNVREFCTHHGISPWFFYDLRRRYAAEGEVALEPRSRAPHRVANRISDDVRDEIVELRKQLADDGLDNGPSTIRSHLHLRHGSAPSEATIWRTLRDRGFIVAQPNKAPKSAGRRFQADRSNEMWQIDATQHTLADGATAEAIDVIDDCSRVLVASRAVDVCTTANSWETLCQAAQQWGWPERLLSDNGMAFRGPGGTGGIVPALSAIGVATTHSRPYHPQTCGKVERVHQTIKKHLASMPPAADLAELQARLDAFREIYNHQRPHRAIARQFPADVWAATPRSGPANNPIGAPTVISHATVTADGRVTIANHTRVGLGTAYAGKHAITVRTGLNAHVFIDGHLIRQLTIDPNRRDQPQGV